MERIKFIEKMLDNMNGVLLAIPISCIIAQAALESAWGESTITTKGNALFGIKAGKNWSGKVLNAKTHEVVNGETVYLTDGFRAYSTWRDSIIDHSNFLRRIPRYTKVLDTTSGYDAAEELQKAGYATDPSYASKLKNIIATYGLEEYNDYFERSNTLETTGTTKPADKHIEILANPGETIAITVTVTSN